MKILHLAAGNRWTGAAALAFAEVEALRAAGIDAHFAYVGGYKLQAKLQGHDFAHPVIARAQNPVSFRHTLSALHRLIDSHGFDFIHAHLTWDHLLARLAARRHRTRVARTFHSRRTLRLDPFTRALMAGTCATFVVNDALRAAPLLRGRNVTVTPPPLDVRLFTPDGPDVRPAYGIGDAPLLAAIGKLSKGRGFEAALETFSLVRRTIGEARLLIIGHGEHRPALEALSRELRIADRVIWAGYHEDDLPEHYRAADVLLFTAAGSDEGHRAVIEAMGCGMPPAAFPIEGMQTLLGELMPQCCASAANPGALADVVVRILGTEQGALRERALEQAATFTFPHAARRLIEGYAAAS